LVVRFELDDAADAQAAEERAPRFDRARAVSACVWLSAAIAFALALALGR
jgi:hypothetical protein